MSVMNLGLEAIGIRNEKSEVLSYEYLDAVIEYSDACDELNVVFDQFDTILRAAQNLEAVRDVIVSQGVTPALEALVGGNFKDGLSQEAVEASMEAAGEAIKNFFVKIWQAIKNFFMKMFVTSKGMVKRLDDWLAAAKTAKAEDFTGRDFTGFGLGQQMQGFKTYVTKLENLEEGELASFDGNFDLQTVTLTFDKAKVYAQDIRNGFESVMKAKDKVIAAVDAKIKEASSSSGSEEDKKDKINAAKAVQKLINKVFKGAFTSGSGFLSHNTLGKQKKAAAPAEGEKKPEDTQEQTPAEGENQE